MKKSTVISIAVGAFAVAVIVTALAVCAVFPNKHSKTLAAAADEFGLDGALVRAVVWTESKFDAQAVSQKGAQGLMQLMPDTFEECATALSIKNADPFDPEDNLRCGCYYLSLMLDKFDGDIDTALAAYNAGEANAKKFLAGELEMFAETKGYIRSVTRARRVYRLIRNA